MNGKNCNFLHWICGFDDILDVSYNKFFLYNFWLRDLLFLGWGKFSIFFGHNLFYFIEFRRFINLSSDFIFFKDCASFLLDVGKNIKYLFSFDNPPNIFIVSF